MTAVKLCFDGIMEPLNGANYLLLVMSPTRYVLIVEETSLLNLLLMQDPSKRMRQSVIASKSEKKHNGTYILLNIFAIYRG